MRTSKLGGWRALQMQALSLHDWTDTCPSYLGYGPGRRAGAREVFRLGLFSCLSPGCIAEVRWDPTLPSTLHGSAKTA